MTTGRLNQSGRGIDLSAALRLSALILLLSGPPLVAWVGAPPLSAWRQVQPLGTIPHLVLPPTSSGTELAADAKVGLTTPLRFAVAHKVEVTPATQGIWEQLPEGWLWRLRIRSAGATDLNLGFTRFRLPEGATLHVVAESEPYFQGPYTARDNKPHGQLWTAVVPGERLVIELFVPTRAREEAQLLLSQVGTGYRDLFHKQSPQPAPLVAEGTCNIDVVCPQAASWTNEIRSVGLYTINGAWACSGTLIADATGDFRSYFLTANHCGLDTGNAPTVVVYWNYQSTNCGTHGPGSLAQNQSGATFRAAKYDVDFALIELDDMPDASFGVYYSGWDRSGTAPVGGVGIHHPESDVKAISFSSTPLTSVNSCIGTGGSNTHWQVIWSSGVTEPGSSGSGFWDSATHQLVGTLSGGYSSCGNPAGPDCYGKFSVGWDSGSSPSERLRDWLDPLNSGVTNMAGLDPALVPGITVAGASLVAESCLPTNNAIDPGEMVTVSFTLTNRGNVSATNLVATLLPFEGVLSPGGPQGYGVLAASGPAVSRSFTFTANGACGTTITAALQLQDGSRSLGVATIALTLGTPNPTVTFSENFDALTAPALPAGWSSLIYGAGAAWATSTAQSDTAPNAVFAADSAAVTDNQLVTPPIAITSPKAQLVFRHSYDTEAGYDGGVLEISINGGGFTDVLSTGAAFITNGYNATISPYYQNPLAGRAAWSGNSGGFVTTIVSLPAGLAGQSIQLRWRFGSDNSTGATGWYVNTISLTQVGYSCCTSPPPLLILEPRLAGSGRMAFSFDSLLGQSYVIETKTSLLTADWSSLQTNSGDGSRQSFTNYTSDSAAKFFRVRTQ
jgi:hypothetical protein